MRGWVKRRLSKEKIDERKQQFRLCLLPGEIVTINNRRSVPDKTGIVRKKNLEVSDDNLLEGAVGLALSGGGIRSSSFSLGVLQALNQHDVIRNIDYLSTVSGGGYAGASLTATLAASGGKFAFGGQPGPLTAEDIKDTDPVRHIRNYSNYLIPRGFRDVMTGAAIIVRGLVANLAVVISVILLAAAVTLFLEPNRASLKEPDLIGWQATDGLLPKMNFVLTLIAAALALLAFFVWGFIRSQRKVDNLAEFRTVTPAIYAWVLVGLAMLLFVEFQPFMIEAMFRAAAKAVADANANAAGVGAETAAAATASAGADVAAAPETTLISDVVATWATWLAAVTAPFAGIVALFRPQLGQIISTSTTNSRWSVFLSGLAANAVVWIAGAALPLIIWVAYLYVAYWGIPDMSAKPRNEVGAPELAAVSDGVECTESTLAGSVTLSIEAGDLSSTFNGDLAGVPLETCPQPAPTPEGAVSSAADDMFTPAGARISDESPAATEGDAKFDHRPAWLGSLSDCLETRLASLSNVFVQSFRLWSEGVGAEGDENTSLRARFSPMVALYLIAGAVLLALALIFRPNANSLHRLYRDRLSKAFLFDPDVNHKKLQRRGATTGLELTEIDTQLSQLASIHAPYHLINAALNVQGSDFANKRGRNADFFLFSPHFVGSEATGYISTKLYEQDPPDLDLGTAMAISGAAFSSNMGSQSVRALAPTLALLNVRLGYWLKNPDYLRFARTRRREKSKRKADRPETNSPETGVGRKLPFSGDPYLAPVYLWREMTGRLHENMRVVYVTDGGHIENLGIYELLKRRCELIVVVDAEADPELTFPSFITLQRYARIDLGVRIHMPWDHITKETTGWMGAGSKDKARPTEVAHGPHVAIGEINYGLPKKGYLVYIKASLTGDENDYVRDYSRRYALFPHEATGDQFFSEEQFEVYRALGFHSADRFLSGKDQVAVSEKVRAATQAVTNAQAPEKDADPIAEAGVKNVADSEDAADATAAVADDAQSKDMIEWRHPSLARVRELLGLAT